MEFTFDWGSVTGEELGDFLGDIAQHCGTEAAQFLLERFGGSTLYAPKTPSAIERAEDLRKADLTDWLVEVAEHHSLRLARMISVLRGGEMVYVPVLGKLKDKAAGRQIRQLYDGRNAGELAARFHMPRRKVLQHARRKRAHAEELR